MGGSQGVRVGLDLLEVERFRKTLDRHPGLRARLFTAAELSYCESLADPALSLAARFAAKEAVGKLLGTGVVSWQEIEILGTGLQDMPGKTWSAAERAPKVVLYGATAEGAERAGIAEIDVSLTHVDAMAAACAAAAWTPGLAGAGTESAGTGAAPCPRQTGAGGERPGLCEPQSVFDRAAVFTPAQVREMDRVAIEDLGIPGPVLMERAALGVASVVRSRFPGRHALVVCGTGNNGGDGLAAARQLHLAGHPVACVVYANAVSDLSPDAALNYGVAEKAGVNLRMDEVPAYLWDETELVVDCLLGTGATGELRGKMVEAARLINAAGARGIPVLAVDVPSGVDAEKGSLAAGAVAADLTVTFHAAKSGLVCPPASEAAGEVLVWDIGIPESIEPEPDLWVVAADDVNVPGRRVDDHKYRAGYLAVLAGSTAYPGAAWLATQAAYKTGAGYVRLLMTAGAAQGMRDRLVEGVLQEIGPGESLNDAELALEVLADGRLGALAVGPGLGREPATVAAVRRVVLESEVPTVLDADGLLAFAGDPEALRQRSDLVLTPHLGELAALMGVPVDEIAVSSLVSARRAAVATGQVVLLKGSSTVVATPSGEIRAVVQGPPQLASAGTGDVLTGVIGALLAKGMDAFEAAYAGAWIHAEAGRLRAMLAPQGILAGDLLDLLPAVVADRVYDQGPSWRK